MNRLRGILEDKEALSPKFLESSPEIRTYGGRIKRIFEHGGLGKEVYVMGYFDQEMLPKMIPIACMHAEHILCCMRESFVFPIKGF